MSPVLPLLMVPEGAEGHVIGVRAGRGLTRRLIEMGFTEDTVVRVLRADRGHLIVDVNGCRFALGKGMSMKIMIEIEETCS